MTETPIQTLDEKIKEIDIQIQATKDNIAIQQDKLVKLADQAWDYNQAIKILKNSGMPKAKEEIETSYIFEEKTSPFRDENWNNETQYKDVKTFRDGQLYKISVPGARIISTFDYLKEFFENAPNDLTTSMIEGLSNKKAAALLRYYEAHPNFHCHIERDGNIMHLVKDEFDVHLNQDTKGGYPAIEFDDAGVVD